MPSDQHTFHIPEHGHTEKGFPANEYRNVSNKYIHDKIICVFCLHSLRNTHQVYSCVRWYDRWETLREHRSASRASFRTRTPTGRVRKHSTAAIRAARRAHDEHERLQRTTVVQSGPTVHWSRMLPPKTYTSGTHETTSSTSTTTSNVCDGGGIALSHCAKLQCGWPAIELLLNSFRKCTSIEFRAYAEHTHIFRTCCTLNTTVQHLIMYCSVTRCARAWRQSNSVCIADHMFEYRTD